MKNFLLSKREYVAVTLGGAASVLLVAGMVYSATTISTDVNTGGTLTVSGASTLSSATLSSTLDVTGATTLTSAALSTTLSVTGASTLTGAVGIASSTPVVGNGLGVQGNVWISGNLSNVANVTATGTLAVTGASTLTGRVGIASSTPVVANELGVQGNVWISGNLSNVSTVVATSSVGVGTTTPAAELSATSAATTTLYLDTSGTNAGSCIEMRQARGATVTFYRIYIGNAGATTTGAALQVEAGSCK